jgi:hypothetical protein
MTDDKEREEQIRQLEREAQRKQAHADALRAETEALLREGKLEP